MIEPNQSAPAPGRTAILILGMHRSGTSAIAGVANALGAAGPKTSMAPDEFNPRGYFESSALSVAFDEMLVSLGSRWHDWRELSLRALSPDVAEPHRTRIKALIRSEFGDQPLIFIKDPRICRFVPFMASILDELGFTTAAILPLRNPLDVAASLKRRNNMTSSKSVLLWLRHVLDAERHSRHMRRAFVPYAALLTDWRKSIAGATSKTGIAWPRRREVADAEIDLFLRSDVHETTCVDELMPSQTRLMREAYDVVTEMAANGETADLLNRLDLVRMKFDQDCELFGAATAEDERGIEKLQEQVGAQHVQIDALHAEVRWRHGEIERLHQEVSRRAADIERLHDEIKQRDGEIPRLHDEVKRRDGEIRRLHDEVKRRDTDIQWLHDEVIRRDADIRWLHDEVKRRDGEIQRIHGGATADDGETKGLNADPDAGSTRAHDEKPDRS